MNSSPFATVADEIDSNRKIDTTPLNTSVVRRKVEITPPNQGVWRSKESQTRKNRKMTESLVRALDRSPSTSPTSTPTPISKRPKLEPHQRIRPITYVPKTACRIATSPKATNSSSPPKAKTPPRTGLIETKTYVESHTGLTEESNKTHQLLREYNILL